MVDKASEVSGVPKRLLVSFSGGETSAFLAIWVKVNLAHLYDEVIFVFANTSEEREETLIFADLCDRTFGLGLHWVEAAVHHNERKGSTARRVDYATASREGEVFEEVIKKYGIPNYKYPHCNRELKLNPIHNYLRQIGWDAGTYDTAIGIRSDEIDRVSTTAKKRRLIYPLISAKITKPKINVFWRSMPFRLELKGYQGNCKWCWKKSFRKHYTLLKEDPAVYNFPDRMEKTYGRVGSEVPAMSAEYKRVFFRGGKSVSDLLAETSKLGGTFAPADDDSIVYDRDLDRAGGCGEESCEIYTDEPDNFAEEVDLNQWILAA